MARKSAEKSKPIKRKPVKKTKLASTLPAPVDTDLAPQTKQDAAKTEALQSYLTQVRQYSLLTPEKELDLAKRTFDRKDSEAARLLILSNLRLVVKIAYEYARTGIHVLDLIQEGNVGLLQAVKEYDPYRGVKLSSYASYWIKAYIRAFILKNWSLVKMGTTRSQRLLFYRLQKEKSKLEAMGIAPQTKLLAERLNVREKDVVEMSQRLSGKDVSLNAPLRAGDESTTDTMLQMIRDTGEATDEKLARQEVESEFHDRLNSFERTLAGKELLIFRERMRAEEPKTLQEIGDTYGITRERVRQIEVRVLEKLKAYMMENAKFAETIIDVKKDDPDAS